MRNAFFSLVYLTENSNCLNDIFFFEEKEGFLGENMLVFY